ncbi:DUF2158 domain-containing protein [Sphingopyxis panaciterrulae]|uniref:YodC family protein n=1 Tax=Sphingopyxis panaciterrulae TaxID=462372 RepID=UPI00161CFED1
MADELEPGDTVQLKSGGPLMTVDIVHSYGEISCVWFAGEKQQSHVFQKTSLVKSEVET